MYLQTGQAVAWCITDREDQDVVHLLLHLVQERSPDVQVKVIMTDDGKSINYVYALDSS